MYQAYGLPGIKRTLKLGHYPCLFDQGAVGFIDWLDRLCSFYDGSFYSDAPRPILFDEIQALIGGCNGNFRMPGSVSRKRRDLENGLTGRVRGNLNDLLVVRS